MLEYYLLGGGLRFFEVVIYSSVWIVLGCFIAAIFRRMLGEEKVRQLFADGTRWGLVTGWLIGMLLPVCSLGVIPVVREMHRAGVKRGTIVAFGLTAPLFNPMSVLYGLTLSDPIAILTFSLCALAIVTLLGLAWDRTGEQDPKPAPSEKMPAPGIKRSIAVFDTASREIVGPTLVLVLIGILASVAVATLVPKGYFQNQVERDNLYAPLFVAIVATPIYSSPLLAMSQIGGMFQHGNSIGGAFSLLILGAGMNFGLLLWFGSTYGIKRVSLFVLMLIGSTVALAYAIDKPLYPQGVEPAGHSHAFDVYTHPFAMGQADLMGYAQTKVADFWQHNEFGGTYLLVGLIALGVIFQLVRRTSDLEAWYRKVDQKKSLDRELPGWVLGVTVVLGLIIASVVGCYLYYPAPEELLADFSPVNTECVLCSRNQEWEAAEKWIAYSDDLSRRLEVGVYLRKGYVGEFQSSKAEQYREKLDELKALVDSRNTNGLKEKSQEVSDAYMRMSAAFRAIEF